ncbi:Uncharacterised protein [Mycobacterium tuberculosis]|uniref:Uncharacterized protein n=3 Tax=Mycobacterium tuberculosis TaxID=1773 RepID=A0A655AXD3_MYCTX|nr:Uncharacterised protein [Mycobacterium tuberculosis]CFR90234.1 Uncharacterised protein [Mycobacterium tuberculosis]CFS09981.1 Uncharacterised protein [Mycobacterium tuberculosis]CFS14381.1 Uncharacterised protein [Mycobacterium tuberculosis]CKU25796.1 Uncharacterised protein [Mycobacterium tuberculosis]
MTMSRAGETHLPNVSMATLASSSADPVTPCTKSPSTPPTMSPLPSEDQVCPVKPSALPRSVSQGGSLVKIPLSPNNALGMSVSACAFAAPLTACPTDAAWLASPAGLMVCAAGLNGDNCVAAADAPA